QTFLARAKAAPAKESEVSARVLHAVHVFSLESDRRVSELVQIAREIVIVPTSEAERVEPIPVAGKSYQIVRARVHRATGETVPAEEQRIEQGRPRIRWPDLNRGDVVEIAVRAWRGPAGGRGDPPYHFEVPMGSYATRPMLHGEVVVESPDAGPLNVDVLGGKPDRTISSKDKGRTTTQYIWD